MESIALRSFSTMYASTKKFTFSIGLCRGYSKQENDFFIVFYTIFIEKTYLPEWLVRVDSTNPVQTSQTTTRHPSARAILDPSGEKATARISSPPRIVNLHARRLCRGLTCSMKA